MLVLAVSHAALAAPAPSQPAALENPAPPAPPPGEPLAPAAEIGATPGAATPPAIDLVPPPLPEASVAATPYISNPAPTAPQKDQPIYERWWFWTAIAAFAVTAVVIVATSSGPNTPKTDLGNQPAF
jgi:hypothetical protein